MERYAPRLMELAPRDMVSRAIYMEVRDGRGIGGKDYVYLDVRHLGREVIEAKLPDITDFARVYQGVEPITQPVPIQPTAHYAMGGVPTNNDDRGRPRQAQHGPARALRRRRVSPASASTAPTGWAPTRSSTCSSSAGGPGARWPSYCRTAAAPEIALDVHEAVRGELEAMRDPPRRREPRPHPRRAGRRDDGRLRRLPDRRGPAPAGAGRARPARALQAGPRPGPGHRLQHGPARGARGRLPARLRRGDRRLGPRPHREPRRPLPRGLPRAERHRLAEAHAGLRRRGRPPTEVRSR